MTHAVESVGYQLTQAQFERFRDLVRARAGIALRPEKQQLVCSRLARRLRELGLRSFDAYYDLVTSPRGDGEELEHLLNAITTNKTSFFREAHHFELLERELRASHAVKTSPPKLRVWSAGCSTGEEPYSIMMTALDALPDHERWDIRLLASDLDTEVLSFGARGVYDEGRIEDLPRSLLDRWFVPGTEEKRGLFRARRALRDRIAFRRINFVDPEWPIHTVFDVIFCRNALIYFDAPTQLEIVGRLITYLRPGGLLFLGHSESLAGVRPELQSLGRTAYRHLGRTP